MKRTFSALVISGALLCTLAVPGMAAEAEGQPGASAARLCTSGPGLSRPACCTLDK